MRVIFIAKTLISEVIQMIAIKDFEMPECCGDCTLNDCFNWKHYSLTISPLKNAETLNKIGERMGELVGVRWLPSDFKKKGGYQQSIELSKKYDLYRQDFCGCGFSKAERAMAKEEINR